MLFWAALTRFDLRPTDVLLMGLIESLAKQKGYCYASKRKLAKTLNVSEPTIYASLRKLEERDLIGYMAKLESGVRPIHPTSEWSDFVEEKRLELGKEKAGY